MTAAQPLAGRTIVVTRPAEQAQHMAELIRAQGGKPLLFPVLEIVDINDLKPLNDIIDRLEQFNWAIFISPNAVRKAINLIRARRSLPDTLKLAAIGRGSTRELRDLGITDVVAPTTRFDSENLLALPQFADIQGQKIVIFRGDGGREFLGDTLIERGALIEYAECYRRARPDASSAVLLRHWARNELSAITVTSVEGLHNLYDMVGKLARQWLMTTPLFVPHERIAEAARSMGLESVHVTPQGDEGMVESMAHWFASA